MTSEQKGLGGSRNTPNLRINSMEFADKEGEEGVKHSKNLVEVPKGETRKNRSCCGIRDMYGYVSYIPQTLLRFSS